MAKKTTKSEIAPEDSGKKQALDLAIAQITKQFGDGSIMKLGETQKIDVELFAVWFPVARPCTWRWIS